jgi:Flp pilus assembly protein TadG
MNKNTIAGRLKQKRERDRGSGLALITLIGFAALAIDVGFMMVTKNELQNVSDSAALAATRELAILYQSPEYIAASLADQIYYASNNKASIVSYAQTVTTVNPAVNVAGKSIALSSGDFLLGHWDWSAKTFTPTNVNPNAVQVVAQRNGAENGPVTTFLAGVVGVTSFNASTVATAALTGVSDQPPCALPLPVGISLAWYSIRLSIARSRSGHPTNDPQGCAGWNVYTESPASAAKLSTLLDQLNNGNCVSPETNAGQTEFNFTGGTLTSVFDEMQTLFNTMRVKNDGVLDQDTDPNTWTTTVPVYDWPDCSNPNARGGPIPIVAFSQ